MRVCSVSQFFPIETKSKISGFIAVGDIHSHPDLLLDILEQCSHFPGKTLVFLGDYISRGPEPEKVLQILQNTEGIFLAGNHELRFLECLDRLTDTDSRKALLDAKKISEKSAEWMKSALQFVYETEDYIFSHSGLNPKKSLSEQTVYDYCESFCETDYFSLTTKTVIHGHISVKTVSNTGNNWSTDTGCGFGGRLSAIILPEKKIIQSSEKSKNWYLELISLQSE
ncbi:MAG TPA: metallophosphoesterase [Leptospiraceae bacterium]|nr:metallophosphoesterase [Leptospiraceae bacterium]HMY69216.1 metallophosphoesterase [Leptospiraceae bacterium]HMZ58370.1 metallophosphoesterase [Leptospiraceae bacterium]HNF15168.1 metallophosphoesterase [Leptospiraceae bacterium]HNF23397.1 metallophosphoesterase [Leptospiraceae bacterium]